MISPSPEIQEIGPPLMELPLNDLAHAASRIESELKDVKRLLQEHNRLLESIDQKMQHSEARGKSSYELHERMFEISKATQADIKSIKQSFKLVKNPSTA